MSDRIQPLTDLERRSFRAMIEAHKQQFPGKTVPDYAVMVILAKASVQALTTGSGSGRRLAVGEKRIPDPGSTPERIRTLARWIEASYHTMPKGWVRADDQLGTRYE